MRQKLILILIMASSCIQLKAQAPQGINYQAALRNNSGNAIASTNVIFRFSIMKGSAAGTIVYQETQAVTTNAQGLANTVIGKGLVLSGSFTGITWGTDPYFIKTEANPGSGFADMGTQQLMSVPYSLYAASAGGLNESAVINPAQISGKGATEGQMLKWNGSAWVPGTLESDATLDGTGVNGDELRLAPQGANTGDVLKWNGSSWVPSAEKVTSAGTGVDIDADGVINTPWTSNGKTIYNNNTGNVGIGTDAPAAKFHLAGKGKEIARVEYTNAAWMNFYNKDSCLGYLGVLNDTAALDFGSSQAGKGLNLVTDSKPRLTIDNNGYVGIGKDRPGCMLDIWNRTGDSYVVSRAGNSDGSSMFRSVNDVAFSLDVFKNGSTAFGNYNGIPSANMAGILNGVGSMAISTTDSMALGAGGASRITLKKTGEVMVNGTSSFSSNSGYLTVGYPAYNSLKPAFEMNGSNVWMGFKNGSLVKGYIQQNADNMSVASMSGDLILSSNNTGRMYIKKDGNISVRTSSPSANFHVDGTGSNMRSAGIFVNDKFTINPVSDSGTLYVYNTYIGSNTAYAISAKTRGQQAYAAYLISQYTGIRANVTGGATGAQGIGGNFSANNPGANYGVSGSASGTATYNYGVYGIASGATNNYAIYCAGNGVYTGTWGSTSDQRLKKEIKPLGSSLDLVMKLKPSSYLYRTDDPKYKSMNLATGTHYGFIAQELEAVIPAIVSNNVHKAPMSEEAAVDFKAVNYTELIPVLTKAIQEQNQLITQQAELIKTLEIRVRQLEQAAAH